MEEPIDQYQELLRWKIFCGIQEAGRVLPLISLAEYACCKEMTNPAYYLIPCTNEKHFIFPFPNIIWI